MEASRGKRKVRSPRPASSDTHVALFGNAHCHTHPLHAHPEGRKRCARKGLQETCILHFHSGTNPEISGWPVEMYVLGDEALLLLNNWRGYTGGSLHVDAQGTRHGGAVVRVDLRDPAQPEIRETVWVSGNIRRSRVVRSESRGEAALYVAASHSIPVLSSLSCEDRIREELRRDGHDDDEIEDIMQEIRDQAEAEGYDYCLWTDAWDWEGETYVQSWSLGDTGLQPVSDIQLGGWITDIQATPRTLMVARGHGDWWERGEGSEVQLIDIGSTSGEMTPRGSVRTRGRVFSQFNMDIHGDILRIVSGSRWGTRVGNFIQTWNIADPDHPEPVDEAPFGFENDDLFATLFLGNRAFFVTYERVDPFYAFEITDEGIATEMNEFKVSGWNDFFRAVHNERRLIGIGMNDEEGLQAAVSLYDITDLSNPEPLIARAEVEARWTWSHANWDHRAFSVLEGAADAEAQDGTPETGLILLPFSGYSDDLQRRISAVQVFTFSEDTLTRRGVMEHESTVRRAFMADPEASLAGNLSNNSFSLFDLANPDAPRARGSLNLSPNYTSYLPLGGLAMRVQARPWHMYWDEYDDMGWEYGPRATPQELEIIETGMHPDIAPTLGAIAIPPYEHYLNLDGRIVATGRLWTEERRGTALHVSIYDVDDPSAPTRIGALESTALLSSGWGWGYGCWFCWSWRPTTQRAWLLGDQLVLASVETTWVDSDNLVPRESCNAHIEVASDGTCTVESEDLLRCEQHYGERSCRRDSPDEDFTCHEYGSHCVERHNLREGTFEATCNEPDWDLLTEPFCREYRWPSSRVERTLRLSHIDLSDPSAPTEGSVIEMGGFDRSASFLIDGDTLYHAWAEDVSVDGVPMLRWFIQPWRFVDGELQAGAALNTPGIAMAIQDGMLLSEDRAWQDGRIRAALRLSRIETDRVVLVDSHVFPDRRIRSLEFDAAEGLIVAVTNEVGGRHFHPRSPFLGLPGQPTRNAVLSRMYDVRVQTFTFDADAIHARGEVPGDHFAQLRMLMGHLALFQMGNWWGGAQGGMLVMNLSDPDAPRASAFHPTRGWPGELHQHDGSIVFPSWQFGLYRIDPAEENLAD